MSSLGHATVTAIRCDGGAVRRTLSVGIATWPVQSAGGAELIAAADRALYAAK